MAWVAWTQTGIHLFPNLKKNKIISKFCLGLGCLDTDRDVYFQILKRFFFKVLSWFPGWTGNHSVLAWVAWTQTGNHLFPNLKKKKNDIQVLSWFGLPGHRQGIVYFQILKRKKLYTGSVLAWVTSQPTDTSKNTRATLKCCYALHNYAGTVFCRDKLLMWQHPPSRTGNQSPEDSMWLPTWQGNRKQSHTQSSHPMECICQCTVAYTQRSAGKERWNFFFLNVQSTMMSVSGPVFCWECYNNNIIILQEAHHIDPVHWKGCVTPRCSSIHFSPFIATGWRQIFI